jgi:hypothetical protein
LLQCSIGRSGNCLRSAADLESARVRREECVGSWLPEPAITADANILVNPETYTINVRSRIAIAFRLARGRTNQAVAHSAQICDFEIYDDPGAAAAAWSLENDRT